MIHQKDIPRVVFSLSLLIQTNNKRASYYRAAAEQTNSANLRALFLKYAEQSESYSSDLTRWVKAYGASPAPIKKTVAVQAWDKLKQVLMIDAVENLPATSGVIEEDTLKVYRTALTFSFLPGAAIGDIRSQLSDFEKARKMFKTMSNHSLMPAPLRQAAAA